MPHPRLVDARWLSEHPDARVADLRWSPAGPPAREKYEAGHVPGAVFVDLDRDLAQQAFARLLSRLGIGPQTHVVVYDDATGSIAARLWFMLRAHGHERASLLDG